ncbi:dihydroneopterin aldolase [Pseudomonas asuensis]|uniref:7,8-dihydroneopterin aldolase n=1 Tax=Pseudomonas asuensis TaxID=1825787 RepID=A0ABQ2GZY8_9PSED|nr:dihydroneopterin aldolase [Pseudomonas asuensis]GGM20348.1 7,8-dihydroneopterin aldolase [Pseudomonas asuensis]
MDKIFIEGLEVDTVIGVYDWEREIRQCLRLDVTMAWDIRPSADNDELDKTLNYAAVAERITTFAHQSSFQLVETFAERLASLLMREFQLPGLRLKITKPGAVPTAAGVGVEIERGCL